MNDLLNALKPFSKAVAATLAGMVVMWLTKNNIVIADGLHDALEVLIGAIIMGISVYLAPKNSEAKK